MRRIPDLCPSSQNRHKMGRFKGRMTNELGSDWLAGDPEERELGLGSRTIYTHSYRFSLRISQLLP
jgi:hypothetical protein